MNTEDRELGWDDAITEDSNAFVVAPAGDYDFEVVDLERTRHTPKSGGKLPPCNKAIVKIRVRTADGTAVDIKHNLFLHSRCESMIGEFLVSIGQKQRDQNVRPDWNRVCGTRGRCKVGVHKWRSDRGEEMQKNEIKRFYDPPTAAAPFQSPPPQSPPPSPVPPSSPVDDTPF